MNLKTTLRFRDGSRTISRSKNDRALYPPSHGGGEGCGIKAREAAQHNSVGEEKKVEEEEEDLSLAYAARGFARYPMVGYIYKANSTSSEEIWL